MRIASKRQSSLRRGLGVLLRVIVLALLLLAGSGLLAWLVGRIVSDRYFWSQWLLWIPTQAAIGLAFFGLLLAVAFWRKRVMLIGWSLCLACVLIYFCFIEYRMLPRIEKPPLGLRIVHWNATRDRGSKEQYVNALIQARGDITITTDAGTIPFHSDIWVWNEGSPLSMRPFAIVTRLPVLTRRYLVNDDQIVIVLLEVDATEHIGQPLVLYLVDLPSEPRIARMELARKARRMLDNANAPEPDVVIGDFNIIRGAASLRAMFPGMVHAYQHAGSGYSATFHRGEGGWLMYHIDHVLLGNDLRASGYEIIDPGIGRHNMQAVTITAR